MRIEADYPSRRQESGVVTGARRDEWCRVLAVSPALRHSEGASNRPPEQPGEADTELARELQHSQSLQVERLLAFDRLLMCCIVLGQRGSSLNAASSDQ
jgi:hypothetical protein